MLTFPPHCSHKLQPLNVSVFGPFKSHCKTSFNDWLQSNPGGRISIHDIAELTKIPFIKASDTPATIAASPRPEPFINNNLSNPPMSISPSALRPFPQINQTYQATKRRRPAGWTTILTAPEEIDSLAENRKKTHSRRTNIDPIDREDNPIDQASQPPIPISTRSGQVVRPKRRDWCFL